MCAHGAAKPDRERGRKDASHELCSQVNRGNGEGESRCKQAPTWPSKAVGCPIYSTPLVMQGIRWKRGFVAYEHTVAVSARSGHYATANLHSRPSSGRENAPAQLREMSEAMDGFSFAP